MSRVILFCTVGDTSFARFETRGRARFGTWWSGLVGDDGGAESLGHAHGVSRGLDQMGVV